MSGICGIYRRDGREVSPQDLEPTLDAMSYYGLDNRSFWNNGPIGLAHLLTRVTPESFHEELPFEQADTQLTITADVRLDNRDELFSIFTIPASEQACFPDSQLILKAYQRWGSDCPKYLLGDFAFAVFDRPEQRLFCARDILGIRPFYYYLDRDIFAFSSDIAALLECPLVSVEFNLSFVHSYLVKPIFFDKEFTFYQNINKLHPATSIVIEPGKVTRQEYWSPGNTAEVRFHREEEYVECLRELLADAVACRMRSSFPTGSHLSSGLDSSMISIIAARILRHDTQVLHTFSWAPPPTPDEYPLKDERLIVEKISQNEQTIQHYTRLTTQDLVSLQTRDITRQPDESLHFESIVCRLAAESGLRVLLSGWGGDEVVAFNGRGYFSDLFRRGQWTLMTRELYMRARLHQGNLWQGLRNDTILPLLPDGFIRLLNPASPLVPHDFPLPSTLQTEFADRLSREKTIQPPNLRERPGVRNNQIRLLQSGHLLKRIESWAANGALSGIEYRYPLLDRRIIEFSLSIPEAMFFKNGWKRYLFRQTGSSILPEEAQWQRMKVDAAFRKNPPGLQVEAFKIIREILIARRQSIQSRGLIDPDAMINGLANLDNTKPAENSGHGDIFRSIWLAFVSN